MARPPRTDGKPPRTKREDDRKQPPQLPGVVSTAKLGTPDKPLVGRPELVIDEVALLALAQTHASFEHMGLILGVSGMTLSDVNKPWRAIIDRGRAIKKKELLAAQFDTAIVGRNPTMQIWLGKQYLDQKDVQRVETTGADGQPIKQEITAKAVAYFPVNNRNKKLPSATATVMPTDGESDGQSEDVPAELEDEDAA